MSCLLRGLKEYSSRVTAIVTVTDNGGSSGRLRKDFDMVPPGDIRNCLVALADGEPLWADVLQYRFDEAELEGHSFGNLLITALTRVTGSFDQAVRELNRLLKVRGRVLPATGSKVSLIAEHHDGSKTTGEVQVTASGKPIRALEMRPRVGPAAADVVQAIAEAELLVFGPGSLFTSVIPNLLVPGIREAVLANPAPKVYVANIMTQPGETTGLSLSEHLDALEAHAGEPFLTGIVVHRGALPRRLEEKYAREGSVVVEPDDRIGVDRGLIVAEADLRDPTAEVVRHDPKALARCLIQSFLGDR